MLESPLFSAADGANPRPMRLGFAGLGLMGRPMAANLLRAGLPLTVYNRSREGVEALQALGAASASGPGELLAACDAVILMLADDEATDAVLGRRLPGFPERVRGRLIVNMGTHSPGYSQDLERDVLAAGGRFVEAPVSGSRGPAEKGELVAMLAGDPADVAVARQLIGPLCREVVEVGAVPSAMAMKLAVNLYLIASVTALAEAASLASLSGLDVGLFAQVIARGPLGSDVSAAKLDRMVRRDFSPQAAIRDVLKNARLVADAASADGSVPLLRESLSRFEWVAERGGGDRDMAAVLLSYEGEGALA